MPLPQTSLLAPSKFTASIAAFCFALILVAPCIHAAPSADTATSPMNVLFIAIDDLRCEVGSYKGGRALTPNIDRLAAGSVKFDHAYAQYPLCNPSRSSVLFGRYPRTSELYGNREWINARYPTWVSLPRYFRQQGYFTLRSGKIFHGDRIDDAAAWTVGGVAHNFNDPKPASVVASHPITREEEARLARMRAADLRSAPGSDYWKAVEDPAELALLADTRVTDRVVEFLHERKTGDRPFFALDASSRIARLFCRRSYSTSMILRISNFPWISRSVQRWRRAFRQRRSVWSMPICLSSATPHA